MERYQTPIISSVIVVFCYIVNTAFTPIPTFRGQLICKASQEWSCILGIFANKTEKCKVKLPFFQPDTVFQHALVFLFVLSPPESFPFLLDPLVFILCCFCMACKSFSVFALPLPRFHQLSPTQLFPPILLLIPQKPPSL